jgi:ATP adenylyltransferase
MKQLWAPWRKSYIQPNKKRGICFLCRASREKKDSQNHILKRSSFNFAILNRYPYNTGHIMIAPNRHVASLSKMNEKEKLDWLKLLDEMTETLQKVLSPQGFNVGLNLGKAAGAGVPGHLHLHIVPRWNGDVNFMPVIADTRVISEALDSIYQTIVKQIKKK